MLALLKRWARSVDKFTMSSRKTNGVGVQVEDTKICVVMVGLPARGKSYIAQRGTVFILLCLANSR
jgi:hypothetical protein